MPTDPKKTASLDELRQAIGPWLWRIEQVTASSGKPISEEMTMILGLVIFDGYELFEGKQMPDPDIVPVNSPLLPGDDGRSNADRKSSYTDASPSKLRDQLNENWKQLRLFARAVGDRDRVIGELHKSIEARDQTIKLQNGLLALSKVKVKLLYGLVGGAAFKGVEALAVAALHHFVK